MNIRFHADDFGASPSINERIGVAFEKGCLNSVSVLATGSAFNDALQRSRKMTGLSIAIHLNLVEGKALSAKEAIPSLVNESGQFKRGFLWFLALSFLPASLTRNISKQIKTELKAQVLKVIGTLKDRERFNVDSHMHFHTTPIVLREVLSLYSEYSLGAIRLPKEKFFFCWRHPRFLKVYFGSGIIKHVLLNLLSWGSKKKITEVTGKRPAQFLGVLFTGMMNREVIKAGLKAVKLDEEVEILLHPGGADENEGTLWETQVPFKDYYLSPWRKQELQTLIDLKHNPL